MAYERSMSNKPSRDLQTFPNPNPDRPYHVHIEVPEFTCLCPLTGQPDFATLVIDYLPHLKNVELKSLKMYMWSYREEGAFHEAVTNKILDDLVAVTDPRYIKLTAKWYVRGGVYTTVVAEHRNASFTPLQKIELDSISTMNPTRG